MSQTVIQRSGQPISNGFSSVLPSQGNKATLSFNCGGIFQYLHFSNLFKSTLTSTSSLPSIIINIQNLKISIYKSIFLVQELPIFDFKFFVSSCLTEKRFPKIPPRNIVSSRV